MHELLQKLFVSIDLLAVCSTIEFICAMRRAKLGILKNKDNLASFLNFKIKLWFVYGPVKIVVLIYVYIYVNGIDIPHVSASIAI